MRINTLSEENNIQQIRRAKEHLQPIKEDENSKDRYVYQYRSLESFWNIITSDSFWATNARFSNDYQEQLLGKSKMSELIGEENQEEMQRDCYIVCFCDDDDKLSQWRGYAERGVSIGFDFRNIRPFYIERVDGKDIVCIYNSCYKVVYVDEKTDVDEFAFNFKLRAGRDKNSMALLKKQSPDIIPYVKHIGFREEAESRLMFSDNDADLSGCIRYRDNDGIKIPYIVVKTGEMIKKDKCVIRLHIKDVQFNDLKTELKEELDKAGITNIEVLNCFDENEKETDDELCYGCTMRQGYVRREIQEHRLPCVFHKSVEDRFYGQPSNEIYLSDASNQEEVCNILYKYIDTHKEYMETKIWCEGHLPIRKVTVGSMKGQAAVIESIKHYCGQKYWLRSVEVCASKTPYRSKLI